jgi:phenylalanyl-tRNA synthetase beta chain
MPTVNVFSDLLFKELERSFTEEEFEELCFDFGIELEEVTSEKTMLLKNEGKVEKAKGLSERPIYRIDIPANRYFFKLNLGMICCVSKGSLWLSSLTWGFLPHQYLRRLALNWKKWLSIQRYLSQIKFRQVRSDHLL